MIDKQTIFEIQRLKNIGISTIETAEKLNLDKKTIARYRKNPVRSHMRKEKLKKLDPYRDHIKELINEFPRIKALVVLRQIKERGFEGEITIVRAYLRELRRTSIYKEPFIRFESDPGEQMQVDWGHFNSLEYEITKRKLYALAVIESHSRMLYVFFTHRSEAGGFASRPYQCICLFWRYTKRTGS